jgi:VWFA-related protein
MSTPVIRRGLMLRYPLFVAVLAMTVTVTGAAQQSFDLQSPPESDAASEAAADEPIQPPIFRDAISFVRVDAIVTDDDGNFVRDLMADDFEIFENDTLQTIESFKLVELTGELNPLLPPPSSIRNEYDQEREAAREDSRIFVFFLDDYHVRDTNAMRLTAPLVEFVQTQLGPTDLVAIMYPLTPLFDVQLTRNHGQIINALEAFQGRKYVYDPRNTYEHEYAHYPTTTVEMIRNDVSLSALKGLAMHLGGLREGRKSVIVLSEGYSDYVPPQLRDQTAAGDGQLSPQRYDPLAGQDRYEETAQFFEETSMRTNLLFTADIANRNNTSFYMVDPRGLAVSEYDMSSPAIGIRTDQRILRSLQDTLHLLSEQTNGRAIVNRNDVLPGLTQVVRDQSAYYLLGYTSADAPTDGEFHEIEVRVRRQNIRIRARKGYYALTELNAARVLAPSKPELPQAFDLALATLAEPVRGRLVRTWVGASRGDNGKTKLTFVWEPIGGNLSRRSESATQVTLMAMNGDATYFRGQVPGRASSTPRAEFDADPGELELNVAIEDEFGEVLDRAVNEVTVPDFTGPDVALSTPAVLRAQNALQMRRIVGDPEAVPTATRYFRRTDELLVRIEAYTPGDTPATITARLLSLEGSVMLDIAVESPLTDRTHQLTLPLAPFPRGDYLIEIVAASGDDTTSEFVAFRVQG